ncbi:MAG: FAD-dependent oxidoreductase [Clostridia bacterium]|nr:FAD-dependent oxidoreductase [Clostridia bacterium]
MYDIIVIGAGTAGMTAAIYARRADKSVLILESGAYGGQIINTPDIANYPVEAHISGFDFATKLYEQTVALGAEFAFERAERIEISGDIKTVAAADNAYEAKAVIIATGSSNRKLGLGNEEKLVGRGVSYCATCDGMFFKGKTVAVAGGGNTAVEDALYLSNLAEKVYLIHRREGFRADKSTLDRLRKRKNVEFMLNRNVTKLIADKKLTAIEVTDRDGAVATLAVDGLFVAVGRIPENESFASLLDLDQSGYAISDETCKTKTPGVFVAGDNRQKELRQLVTAASDGAIAASEAVKYLNTL